MTFELTVYKTIFFRKYGKYMQDWI